MSSPAIVFPTHSLAEAARAIVAAGRYFGERDMVPATSGNFSMRLDEHRAAITRSGVDKGELVEADILEAQIEGPLPRNSSAETPLHLAVYRACPQVGAVLHTHSTAATLLSLRHEKAGAVVFEGYEMQKAISGQTTHEAALALPVFPNSQDIPALAEEIAGTGAFEGPARGFLLAGHGLYAWGATMAEARRHVVAYEFLLNCELEKLRFRP
ncbi:methylthioribulose 1-phosphate dehydratase [Telmatospirillum sp. J64-1]|uniref:methylthioribulose 1-phosphate dehydratase n=1 Tax=Telmatospirillum sp. J64-1 TaxID=2502183 RepID=UPI00210451B1|nr:methylthioribulose 1-phosphate dehydratase [Telmatospirillum sp. J64-1]